MKPYEALNQGFKYYVIYILLIISYFYYEKGNL